MFLWPGGIIGVHQISGFCCGVDIFVLCLDLFSPFRSTQSLRVRPSLRSPSLFPSSSLFSPCCYFCLLPLSLNLPLQCSNPVFFPCPPLLFPSFSTPPSCLHLLSQGPCGTLRGWWGWGWWWCRWWNSHSVSFVPSPTAGNPVPLVPFSRLFLSHFGNKMQRGWGGRQGGRLPVYAGFIHASQCKHTPPSRHISHLCLCDTALCLSPLTTNSNPYCQNSITHKQGQTIMWAHKEFHFQMCFVVSVMLGCSFLSVKIISLPWSCMISEKFSTMQKTYYYVTKKLGCFTC